jgi:hypothetical protein
LYDPLTNFFQTMLHSLRCAADNVETRTPANGKSRHKPVRSSVT